MSVVHTYGPRSTGNLVTLVPSSADCPMHLSSSTAGKSKLTLGYFNAQSARQKAGETCEFVVDDDLDVLILTEPLLLVGLDESCLRDLTPSLCWWLKGTSPVSET